MCSLRRKRFPNPLCANWSKVGALMCMVSLVLMSPAVTLAVEPPAALNVPGVSSAPEAWLVTYGPGEIYWQRFGHNAIWLREPERGLDHTFNFGYFDFAQENFLVRFARGRMLYFSLPQPALEEFAMYRRENRGISAQKLNLLPGQYRRLRDYLLNEVQPANREYLYDYYLNNCSTRVRDALDLALEGALSSRFLPVPAAQNFRDHTRRLTAMDFWYYLGLEAGLGSPVDRANSRWEEMFIPGVVAESLGQLSVAGRDGPRPLVSDQHVIFATDASPPPTAPLVVWPRYLLLGLALAALAWLAGRSISRVLFQGLVFSWVLLAGTGGLVLAALWGFTDHQAAGANMNILLFNPLIWIALFPTMRSAGAVLLGAGAGLAIILASIPGGQYNLDVLALAAPLNLGCASVLWRWPKTRDKAAIQG